MSSQEYLRNAINIFEEELEEERKPPLRYYGKKIEDRHFPLTYRPEVNIPPELRNYTIVFYSL